jgi:hypothetical protein
MPKLTKKIAISDLFTNIFNQKISTQPKKDALRSEILEPLLNTQFLLDKTVIKENTTNV